MDKEQIQQLKQDKLQEIQWLIMQGFKFVETNGDYLVFKRNIKDAKDLISKKSIKVENRKDEQLAFVSVMPENDTTQKLKVLSIEKITNQLMKDLVKIAKEGK